METIEKQLNGLLPIWEELIESIKPDIEDDFKEFEDDEPSICLTIGFTPESEKKDCAWHYQTGDNSYSGGAYFHRNWGIVSIYRDSDAKELAEDIANQIGESLAY